MFLEKSGGVTAPPVAATHRGASVVLSLLLRAVVPSPPESRRRPLAPPPRRRPVTAATPDSRRFAGGYAQLAAVLARFAAGLEREALYSLVVVPIRRRPCACAAPCSTGAVSSSRPTPARSPPRWARRPRSSARPPPARPGAAKPSLRPKPNSIQRVRPNTDTKPHVYLQPRGPTPICSSNLHASPLLTLDSMAPSPSPAAAASRLVVIYASQTGNAIDAAERVGREAERGGCPAVDVLSMDSFDPSCLPGERFVVFVVSTTGQGDPPDSMKGFWKYLLKKDLDAKWLEGVHYAVFGLGDSGYQKYNFAAKKLDRRLLHLGAEPIIEKGLGDDQHPSGYEGALDPWLLSLWKSLNQTTPSLLPRISDIIHPNLNILGDAKVKVIYYSSDEVQQDSSPLDSKRLIDRARSMSPALRFNNDGEPHYMLQMVTNQRLTKEESDRDVRHFELENPSSGITYQVGDALEILPSQNSSAIDTFIERCNLDPDCYITIQAKDGDKGSKGSLVNGFMNRIKLKTFIALTMDIASASPRRYFFEVMSFFATAEHEKEKLQYFSSPEGRDDLYQYNQKEGRTVLEVLEDFPSVQMPFEWLVQLTPPLKKRAFSISSSPLTKPNQIHLTVSIVSWLTPFKRTRHGLCSTWLAGLSPNEENLIPCWVHHGSLPPPHPSTPLVLIGPGTGCAPFRAFVEERAAQSTSEPTAPILFFFGCRNQDSDFLYKDFWLNHSHDQGVLSLKKGGGFFVAFSRDQPQKVYVQHKIKEQSARVWNLLGSGAAIYIAGSSTKMPTDVTAALEEVLCQNFSKEDASRWLKAQERAGRFNIETWS